MTEPTKEAIKAASDFIPAKMGHTLRIALAVAFDAFAAQRVAEAVERCAKIADEESRIVTNSLCDPEMSDDSMQSLMSAAREAAAIAKLIRVLKGPRR